MIALLNRLDRLRRQAAVIAVLVFLALAVAWAHGGAGMDHVATMQAAGVCLAVVESAVTLGCAWAKRPAALYVGDLTESLRDPERPPLVWRGLPFARAGPPHLQVFRC